MYRCCCVLLIPVTVLISNRLKSISLCFTFSFSDFTLAYSLSRSKNWRKLPSSSSTFRMMLSKLLRNRIGLIEFIECCKNNAKTSVYDFNTINEIPNAILPTEIVDIVVTSPPYGDSRTTVAYGQYSRLANEWLGFKDANKIDRILMGGEKKKHIPVFKSGILNDVIDTIQKEDKERALDVISFYEDYEKSIKNVSDTIKKGGFACYVVGLSLIHISEPTRPY